MPAVGAVTADQALYLARLIAPDWRETRGCVIRADTYEPDNLERWWSAAKGNPNAVEAGLNHAWRATLARDFPGRQFEVTLDDDYGPTSVAISTPPPVA
jgi:hypothetical protein